MNFELEPLPDPEYIFYGPDLEKEYSRDTAFAYIAEVNDKKTYHVKFFRGRLLDPFGIDASKSQDMFAEYKKVAKNTFKFYVDYLKTRRRNNLTWAERSHIDV